MNRIPTLPSCALVLAVSLTAAAVAPSARACHFASHFRLMEERMGMEIPPKIQAMLHLMEADHTPLLEAPLGGADCIDGLAGGFPCANVDLLAVLPTSSIGGGNGNDIWGWTDPVTGKDWAIMGRTNGVSFVDVSDPADPIYVGNLPTQSQSNTWRDMKVYRDHVFIVADFTGAHGMQVFDLTRLRSVVAPPVTYDPATDLAAHYTVFGSAHNIVINEDTGFAYVVGASEVGQLCNGGLHMIDIQDPAAPAFAGCYTEDGYIHDAQCVVYAGPDVDHQGKEICFASSGGSETLTVVDVTDKAAPQTLSVTGYADSGYTHQGWVTADHRFFIIDDELDETSAGVPDFTRTYTWDISDLDDPLLVGTFIADGISIDHNQYVHQGYTFQANYRRGLRILDIVVPETGTLAEVAFFDTYPEADSLSFSGAWSVYPYFESGTVVVSDMNRGLFVLRPRLPGPIFEDGFESGDASEWGSSVEP